MSKTFELAGLNWQIDPLDLDAQIEVECILIRTLAPSAAAGAASLIQGLAPALVEVLRETVLGGGERITDFESEALARDAKRSEVFDRGEDNDPRWAIIDPNGELLAEYSHEAEARGNHRELTEARIQRRGSRWLLLTVGREDKFDLARVTKIDTGDPRLRIAWDRLLDALAETGGEVIREVMFTVAQTLGHREIMRLFELVVFEEKTLVSDPLGERCSRMAESLEGPAAWKVLSSYLRHDPSAKYELLGKALMVTYRRPLPPLSAEEEALLAASSEDTDEGEDA